jgi:NADH-quinone oxidoreductase subunit F
MRFYRNIDDMTKEKPLTKNIRPDGPPCNLQEYVESGGYRGLRKALSDHDHEEVIDMVVRANLLGRGGAGFPAGKKWSLVPMGEDVPRPKYVVCNFDEMEPGSFKDRFLVEGDPHQLIEGMILAGYAIEAEVGYIFIRRDYVKAARILSKAIKEAYGKNYLGTNIMGQGFNYELHLHVSAGRYICGESSALLNALEGGRAIPRSRPPHMSTVGLWGKPTVVNNVETICNVPHIVANGPDWFRELSYTEEGGTKIYGASGRVKKPGAWELPMGTTLREILEEHAGGLQVTRRPAGRRFKRVRHFGATRHEDGFCIDEKSAEPFRHGHGDRARQWQLSTRHGAEPAEVFLSRIVRLVHTMPRRAALDRPDARSARRRQRHS